MTAPGLPPIIQCRACWKMAPSGLHMYSLVTSWPCFWIASMVMNTGVA